MNLSYIDLLLALTVCYNVFRGWQGGFIIGVLDLVGWVGSLLAAFRFYGVVAEWLGPTVGLPGVLARPVAFGVVAILTGLLFLLVSRSLLSRLPAWVHVNELNRLLGLLPGLVSGLIAAAIVATLLLSLPINEGLLRTTQNSLLATRLAARTELIEAELVPIFGDAISQTLNLLTIHPESDETVLLPYAVTDAQPAPELEQEMLVLINQERSNAGLPPLVMDAQLTEVARDHSADMFARGYFSHATPEGFSPFDRIRAAGISYLIAGENLAHAATLSVAHRGLMNSPGHRANILHPDFGRVGIGILDGGLRGLMITQNFRD